MDDALPETRFVTCRLAGVVLLVMFVFTLGLQWNSEAYRSDLAGHADEPAHFVTGLLAHDYLVSGLGDPPRQFAEAYYAHYPKVAIGHWPPGFYALLAVWFMVFGPSVAAALLLMSLLTALLAGTVCLVVRSSYGWAAGAAAGTVCAAMPLVQDSTVLVMSDTLVALGSLWATLLWGRYLANPNYRTALLFGLCAASTLLCKANGLAIVLSAPLAVALTGRWRLCGKLNFWLPVGILLAVCLPWYLATLDLAFDGVIGPELRIRSIARALLIPGWVAVKQLGYAFCAAALLGMLPTVRRRGENYEQRAALLAYLPAFVVVHGLFVAEAFTPRYLVLIVPALLIFATDAIAWLCGQLARLRPLARVPQAAMAVVLTTGVVLGMPWRIVHKSYTGYTDVVEHVIEQAAEPVRILISSHPQGEGALIAAAALIDLRRPKEKRCTILRGSQLLSSSTWAHQNYQLRFRTIDEVMLGLREAKVDTVVLDMSQPAARRTPDQRLLDRALIANPDEWHHAGEYPLTIDQIAHPRGLVVFARK